MYLIALGVERLAIWESTESEPLEAQRGVCPRKGNRKLRHEKVLAAGTP